MYCIVGVPFFRDRSGADTRMSRGQWRFRQPLENSRYFLPPAAMSRKCGAARIPQPFVQGRQLRVGNSG
jgi:hypothetical protein